MLISAVALAAIGLAVAGRPSGGTDPAAGPDGVGPAAAPVPRRWRWGLPGRPALFAYVGFNYGTILLFLFVVPLHLNECGQDAALGAAVLLKLWPLVLVPALLLRGDWRRPLERYGVELVLIESGASLEALLSESDEWRRVYRDERAVAYYVGELKRLIAAKASRRSDPGGKGS